MKRDVQETAARHFISPKSYVTKDGREVLYEEDWELRKGELWERSGGKCEFTELQVGPDLYMGCRSEAADPHHIVRRSVKRDDRLSNLQALCRFHHDLLDKRKVRWNKRGESQNPSPNVEARPGEVQP